MSTMLRLLLYKRSCFVAFIFSGDAIRSVCVFDLRTRVYEHLAFYLRDQILGPEGREQLQPLLKRLRLVRL